VPERRLSLLGLQLIDVKEGLLHPIEGKSFLSRIMGRISD